MKIIRIGRDENNDIVIDDPLVTRNVHCQIISDEPNVFYLIDDSTNGTFVNGTRVGRGSKVPLNTTDIIRIGNTTLPWRSYFIQGPERTKMAPVNNISSGNNIVNIGYSPASPPVNPSPVNKPDNFLVWSILGTIFCCLPFGIVSIVNACKVDSRWQIGDYEGAREAARKARTWFWWGFWLGILSLIVNIILFVAQVSLYRL